MAECTCFELSPEMWHTHYGAVEPGSTHEPNPECPEHFPKNKQYCKDCLGAGETSSRWTDVCHTCGGTGTVTRTGPYRLADGTWSDGVDRSLRICDQVSTDCDQNRVFVWHYYNRHEMKHMWTVDRQSPFIDMEFSTWTEAIRYADRAARTTKNGDNK